MSKLLKIYYKLIHIYISLARKTYFSFSQLILLHYSSIVVSISSIWFGSIVCTYMPGLLYPPTNTHQVHPQPPELIRVFSEDCLAAHCSPGVLILFVEPLQDKWFGIYSAKGRTYQFYKVLVVT